MTKRNKDYFIEIPPDLPPEQHSNWMVVRKTLKDLLDAQKAADDNITSISILKKSVNIIKKETTSLSNFWKQSGGFLSPISDNKIGPKTHDVSVVGDATHRFAKINSLAFHYDGSNRIYYDSGVWKTDDGSNQYEIATLNTKLDDFNTPDDNIDLNVSNTYHGLCPKLDDDTDHFFRGDGTWADPPGAGGGEANTASNQGADGVGVYRQKTGVDLEFRHVAPGSNKITATLNAQDIDIDVVEGNIKLDDLGTPDDNTDLDVSTSHHGLCPKLDNDVTHFLNGQGGFTAPSIDSAGITWTIGVSAADNDWLDITWGNGLYVGIAKTGTGNRVMTSPDGKNWTIGVSAANNDWRAITYANGLFVAVASTGVGNRVMTSPDGKNWTIGVSAANNSWRGLTYGNGLFVAVADTGTNRIMTSPNGFNWTLRAAPVNNYWRAITYGNNLFVAVAYSGTNNRVMTSPNGTTWTIRTSAANNTWNAVTYANGLFVAVASTGTNNRVMTSSDGFTWVSRTSAADNDWIALTYGNGLFVAVGKTGVGNRVMTSPDGTTWTIRTSAADNSWGSIVYANGRFVALAYSGTSNRVMTSGKTDKNIIPHNNTYQGGMNIFGDIALGTVIGTKIGTAAAQKLGFFGVTPIVQLPKASYNNWAALSDVVNALVAVGLFDAA